MSGGADRLAAALADRYRIERELGEGGMATVYLAEDLKPDRRVAAGRRPDGAGHQRKLEQPEPRLGERRVYAELSGELAARGQN